MGQVQFGYLQFNGGTKFYVEDGDYNLITNGSTTEFIPTARGLVLDLGYAQMGFEAKCSTVNASAIGNLTSMATSALASKTPITVVDTVYPGGKTWTGFIRLPIFGAGAVTWPDNPYGVPSVLVSPVTIRFVEAKLTLL
jgi:hypothetical protein